MEKYFIGIYCAPAVPAPGHPNRVTPRAYRLLREAGVEHVFGFFEDKAGKEYLEMALEYAGQAGISFYPRLEVFNRFMGITGSERKDNLSYLDMPLEARRALDEQFLGELAACAKYPSFGGIFMGDERGSACFPGIGAAQKLFTAQYPDKGFFYNNLNYFVDEQLFYYSDVPVAQQEKSKCFGRWDFGEENRFRTYERFISLYRQQVDAPYISTDIYPFALTWKDIPNAVHRGLYEQQSFFADLKAQTGLKQLTYVQVGSWECNGNHVGKNEIALHFGIAAAYDFDGFIFFPGCFPNDWLDTPESDAQNGETGLLDVNGEPTKYYADTQRIVAHFQELARYIHGAQWLGVEALGAFDGGFGAVAPKDVEWGSCIYQGGLPENEKHRYSGPLPQIQAKKQLFIGVFRDGQQEYLLLVNNSVAAQNTVTLPGEVCQFLQEGVCRENTGAAVSMEPGESILAILR